ncbi:hypothetical protein RRG08_065121 [Elysia crispata]|uniref:Uncharacterized protein n=1 Tax=Elysia crispata TaxID=231223 RepID=A0AAE0Z9S8_9GAST|nr:hypothetical protein RRG08_065121 [Elysia crispata]
MLAVYKSKLRQFEPEEGLSARSGTKLQKLVPCLELSVFTGLFASGETGSVVVVGSLSVCTDTLWRIIIVRGEGWVERGSSQRLAEMIGREHRSDIQT